MKRTILHCDFNNFYASVACKDAPSLKGKPVAVCGDADARHGIVLAKNEVAKKFGVQTGEVLWSAKQKCPNIVFVPACFPRYLEISAQARQLYRQYTDQVEPFGLDECWLDVTGSTALLGSGKDIADSLRQRVKEEMGLTISIGVSFNKVFAKLGSDLKKPDGTTEITEENYTALVWPLAVSDLLYVGPATTQKLTLRGITTIGQLAAADPNYLHSFLGKNGLMLWSFANGSDVSPVSVSGSHAPIKSIGNSTTTPRDLVTEEDVSITLYALCESVSARLRSQGLVCGTVQLSIRDFHLYTYSRQAKLPIPCRTANALFQTALCLYHKHHQDGTPIRSLGLCACDLMPEGREQLSLLPEVTTLQKQEQIEKTIDAIRQKYGFASIQRGIMLSDPLLANVAPKLNPLLQFNPFLRQL